MFFIILLTRSNAVMSQVGIPLIISLHFKKLFILLIEINNSLRMLVKIDIEEAYDTIT